VVYHGNCLDVLKTLADNSVDAIITDPPYDLTGGEGAKGGFNRNFQPA
jgi:site-specific DNA-methyltransferase (adenine-specific)